MILARSQISTGKINFGTSKNMRDFPTFELLRINNPVPATKDCDIVQPVLTACFSLMPSKVGSSEPPLRLPKITTSPSRISMAGQKRERQ